MPPGFAPIETAVSTSPPPGPPPGGTIVVPAPPMPLPRVPDHEQDDDLMEPATSSHDGGPPPDQPPAPFTINVPVLPTPPLAEDGGTSIPQSIAPVSIFHPAPPIEGYGNPDSLLENRRRGHDTQTADDRTRERSRGRDIRRRPNRSAPPTARTRNIPVPAAVPSLPAAARPLPFREASTRPQELQPQPHTPSRRRPELEHDQNKKKKKKKVELMTNYQEGGSTSVSYTHLTLPTTPYV
mgnify:CR=1 FL=1